MSEVQCVGCIDAITPKLREARDVGRIENLRVLVRSRSSRAPGTSRSTARRCRARRLPRSPIAWVAVWKPASEAAACRVSCRAAW